MAMSYLRSQGPKESDYRRSAPGLYELTWTTAKRSPLLGNAIISQKRHRLTGDARLMDSKLRSLQTDPSYVQNTGNLRRLIDTTALMAESQNPGYRFRRDSRAWLEEAIDKLERQLASHPKGQEWIYKRIDEYTEELIKLKEQGVRKPPIPNQSGFRLNNPFPEPK